MRRASFLRAHNKIDFEAEEQAQMGPDPLEQSKFKNTWFDYCKGKA